MTTGKTTSLLSPAQICGVVVAYQPQDALYLRLQSHLQQLEHLIVVENGCQSAPDATLQAFAADHSGITLLHLHENNLARAQNLGILKAKELNYQAIMLLDDDSTLQPGMLSALLDAYDNPQLGLIAPDMREANRREAARYVVPWLKVAFKRIAAHQQTIDGSFTPVASGSLIPLSVIGQVGLMDERFEIDYVDREFCLRLLSRGYQTRVAGKAQLIHQLGTQPEQAMAGLPIPLRNHSPARRHTIFRNRVRCWARYGLCVPSFLLYDVLAACHDLLRITLFEEDKSAKLLACWRGVWEAIAGGDDANMAR